MDFWHTYILKWQLPTALFVASWAIIAMQTALRKVRISDLDALENGPVEQVFLASLWVGIAAIIYPYAAVLIVGVWGFFIYHHLMTLRSWMASSIAIALCALWYYTIGCLIG